MDSVVPPDCEFGYGEFGNPEPGFLSWNDEKIFFFHEETGMKLEACGVYGTDEKLDKRIYLCLAYPEVPKFLKKLVEVQDFIVHHYFHRGHASFHFDRPVEFQTIGLTGVHIVFDPAFAQGKKSDFDRDMYLWRPVPPRGSVFDAIPAEAEERTIQTPFDSDTVQDALKTILYTVVELADPMASKYTRPFKGVHFQAKAHDTGNDIWYISLRLSAGENAALAYEDVDPYFKFEPVRPVVPVEPLDEDCIIIDDFQAGWTAAKKVKLSSDGAGAGPVKIKTEPGSTPLDEDVQVKEDRYRSKFDIWFQGEVPTLIKNLKGFLQSEAVLAAKRSAQ